MLDTKLLEILVCPVTKGKLEYDKKNDQLISRAARLVFPVHDGIPVLLEDQATELLEE